MKTIILVLATLTVTTSAFAQAGGPIRSGNKCWAVTDQRGYGFWDKCATGNFLTEINQRQGTHGITHAVTMTATSFGGGDGGGAGGGGK
jgi:hypothetical protein